MLEAQCLSAGRNLYSFVSEMILMEQMTWTVPALQHCGLPTKLETFAPGKPLQEFGAVSFYPDGACRTA